MSYEYRTFTERIGGLLKAGNIELKIKEEGSADSLHVNRSRLIPRRDKKYELIQL